LERKEDVVGAPPADAVGGRAAGTRDARPLCGFGAGHFEGNAVRGDRSRARRASAWQVIGSNRLHCGGTIDRKRYRGNTDSVALFLPRRMRYKERR
jgi:hypothetical protein